MPSSASQETGQKAEPVPVHENTKLETVTEQTSDHEQEQLAGLKRKQPEKKSGRFKILGHMVMAMQRFQASLNPTYTYGKRPESSLSGYSSGSRPGSAMATGDVEAPVTSRDTSLAGSRRFSRSGSGNGRLGTSPSAAERYAYNTHGHKGNYLFKPLPPAPAEVTQE